MAFGFDVLIIGNQRVVAVEDGDDHGDDLGFEGQIVNTDVGFGNSDVARIKGAADAVQKLCCTLRDSATPVCGFKMSVWAFSFRYESEYVILPLPPVMKPVLILS